MGTDVPSCATDPYWVFKWPRRHLRCFQRSEWMKWKGIFVGWKDNAGRRLDVSDLFWCFVNINFLVFLKPVFFLAVGRCLSIIWSLMVLKNPPPPHHYAHCEPLMFPMIKWNKNWKEGDLEILLYKPYIGFPVAQLVEHGTSNAKIMGSIPRESKSW